MFLNVEPRTGIDFADEPEFFQSLEKRSWKRMGKEEAIEMVHDAHYAFPTQYETYGDTIIKAIEEFFDQ